jgi:hypothetical protein
MNINMVTGIKTISQQQVINSNTMGLNGINTTQMPSQEMPIKRATASDTRRVSIIFISQCANFQVPCRQSA